MIVLDASAYLACLFREPGHEQVAPQLRECCLSTVNLAEVVSRFTRDGHDAAVVAPRLSAAVRENFCHERCTFRNGTLEDVFLRLTGRELRE